MDPQLRISAKEMKSYANIDVDKIKKMKSSKTLLKSQSGGKSSKKKKILAAQERVVIEGEC